MLVFCSYYWGVCLLNIGTAGRIVNVVVALVQHSVVNVMVVGHDESACSSCLLLLGWGRENQSVICSIVLD